jgi:hypothetical protein
MKRKHHYTDFEQHKLHRIPGSKRSFGWFRDTFTQRAIILVRGVEHYKEAKPIWKTLISDDELDGEGYFDGLHCAIGGIEDKAGIYKGSLLFLATKSRALLAHEMNHAVTRCFDYLHIDNEEARCLALSSWMETAQKILKLKDEA